MASTFDDTEFIDTEFQVRKASLASAPSATPSAVSTSTPLTTFTPPVPAAIRPPTREELEGKVSLTQQRLAELKRAQEELERERAQLEEARRRRTEFQTGCAEMVQFLTRGDGLLQEAEFAARRDAEQMARTLAGLREALAKVQAITEAAWTQENYNSELTRALTTIENARMEWNSARLKWPLLDGALRPVAGPEGEPAGPALPLGARDFKELCRIGLAFTWPVVLVGLGILLVMLLKR